MTSICSVLNDLSMQPKYEMQMLNSLKLLSDSDQTFKQISYNKFMNPHPLVEMNHVPKVRHRQPAI